MSNSDIDWTNCFVMMLGRHKVGAAYVINGMCRDEQGHDAWKVVYWGGHHGPLMTNHRKTWGCKILDPEKIADFVKKCLLHYEEEEIQEAKRHNKKIQSLNHTIKQWKQRARLAQEGQDNE